MIHLVAAYSVGALYTAFMAAAVGWLHLQGDRALLEMLAASNGKTLEDVLGPRSLRRRRAAWVLVKVAALWPLCLPALVVITCLLSVVKTGLVCRDSYREMREITARLDEKRRALK